MAGGQGSVDLKDWHACRARGCCKSCTRGAQPDAASSLEPSAQARQHPPATCLKLDGSRLLPRLAVLASPLMPLPPLRATRPASAHACKLATVAASCAASRGLLEPVGAEWLKSRASRCSSALVPPLPACALSRRDAVRLPTWAASSSREGRCRGLLLAACPLVELEGEASMGCSSDCRSARACLKRSVAEGRPLPPVLLPACCRKRPPHRPR